MGAIGIPPPNPQAKFDHGPPPAFKNTNFTASEKFVIGQFDNAFDEKDPVKRKQQMDEAYKAASVFKLTPERTEELKNFAMKNHNDI